MRKVKKVLGRHGMLTNRTKNEGENRKSKGEIQRGGKSYTTWSIGLHNVEHRKGRRAGDAFSLQRGRKWCHGFSESLICLLGRQTASKRTRTPPLPPKHLPKPSFLFVRNCNPHVRSRGIVSTCPPFSPERGSSSLRSGAGGSSLHSGAGGSSLLALRWCSGGKRGLPFT